MYVNFVEVMFYVVNSVIDVTIYSAVHLKMYSRCNSTLQDARRQMDVLPTSHVLVTNQLILDQCKK